MTAKSLRNKVAVGGFVHKTFYYNKGDHSLL